MIVWSFFYLQVYLWITATGLPEFMSTYGNHKNVTSFLSFLEKNDGGARSVRFVQGGSSHRGYYFNVNCLPSQLVRRLFSLVCIVKKCEKILFFFFVSLCERRLCLSWRLSTTSWRRSRLDRLQSLLPAMKMEEKCLALQPLKKRLTWTRKMTKTRLEKVMDFEKWLGQNPKFFQWAYLKAPLIPEHTEPDARARWRPFQNAARNNFKRKGRKGSEGEEQFFWCKTSCLSDIWYFSQKTAVASRPGGEGIEQAGKRKRAAAPQFNKKNVFF